MVNKMVFKTRKSADDFLKCLIDYNINNEDENTFNDIHIYQEECYIVVEWVQIPYERDYGGSFQYVDEDEVIVREFQFPDNSYGYEFEKGDKEQMIKDWLDNNPGWHKTLYGTWTFDEQTAEKE